MTRDQTWVPCIGSVESQPLNQQQSPRTAVFKHAVSPHPSSLLLYLHSIVCMTSNFLQDLLSSYIYNFFICLPGTKWLQHKLLAGRNLGFAH